LVKNALCLRKSFGESTLCLEKSFGEKYFGLGEKLW